MIRVFVAVLSTLLLAWADRPPVPDVGHAVKKQEVLKSCKVPAQVVVIPPMAEEDYRDCVNRYYMPDSRDAKYNIEKMLGKKVEIKELKIADSFIRAYELDLIVDKKPLKLLCDEKVVRCFEITKVYTKDKK